MGREDVAQDPSPGCVIGFPCTELNAGCLFLSRIKDGFLSTNNTLFLLWKETGRVLTESHRPKDQRKVLHSSQEIVAQVTRREAPTRDRGCGQGTEKQLKCPVHKVGGRCLRKRCETWHFPEGGWVGGLGSSESSSPPPPHFLAASEPAGDRRKLFLASHNKEQCLSCLLTGDRS